MITFLLASALLALGVGIGWVLRVGMERANEHAAFWLGSREGRESRREGR